MELTPIKIPGKRKRRRQTGAKAAGNGNRHRSLQFHQIASRFSVASGSVSATSPKAPKQRTLKSLKSKNSMATIERLPIELLEKIFFFSLNFDLPRASPIIAGKLSSEHVYLRASFLVFSPSWQDRYESVQSTLMKVPKVGEIRSEQKREFSGNSGAQTALLRCRWARLPILRKAEKLWLSRATNTGPEGMKIVDATSIKSSSCGNTEADVLVSQSGTRIDVARFSQITPASADDPRSGETFWLGTDRWYHETEDAKFESDFSNFLSLTEWKVADSGQTFLRPPWRWEGYLQIHPLAEIPKSLLCGPWTDDMVKRLFWLVRAGARIDWYNSISGEVARSGLNQSIVDENLGVLYIFHCLGLNSDVEDPILRWAMQYAGGNRMGVMIRLFDMAASRYMWSPLPWDDWFETISQAAQSRCNSVNEKQEAEIWFKDFKANWLRLTQIQAPLA